MTEDDYKPNTSIHSESSSEESIVEDISDEQFNSEDDEESSKVIIHTCIYIYTSFSLIFPFF